MTAIIYISLIPLFSYPASFRTEQHFLSAIRVVESDDGEKVFGDDGKAIGPYQIHYAYWKDSGVSGRWQQCKDRQYSEKVIRAYWQRYCPEAVAKRDWQKLARIHNGGPRGHAQSGTLKYWKKVCSALKPSTARQ